MLKQEAFITEYLNEKTDVPVPKIYIFDDTKQLLNKNYFIMEKIEGVSLEKVENELTKSQTKNLFEKIGKVLKKINNVNYGYKFGYYEKDIVPTYKTNYKFMCNEFECAIKNYIDRGGNLSSGNKIKQIYENNKEYFIYNGEPTVSSNDLHSGNLMVKKTLIGYDVTAVLDWGDLHLVSPEFEFTKVFRWLAKSDPLKEKSILKGYSIPPSRYSSHKNLYRLYHCLTEIRWELLIKNTKKVKKIEIEIKYIIDLYIN